MNDEMKVEIAALQGMTTIALVDRYESLWGKPPRVKHVEYLRKRIAWKILEQKYGGLSTLAKQRLEELIAEIKIDLGESRTISGVLKTQAVKRRADGLTPGTILRRTWRDQEIEVRVLEDGFEFAGTKLKSLSAVAKVITGTHWNGRLFFGLTHKKETA